MNVPHTSNKDLGRDLDCNLTCVRMYRCLCNFNYPTHLALHHSSSLAQSLKRSTYNASATTATTLTNTTSPQLISLVTSRKTPVPLHPPLPRSPSTPHSSRQSSGYSSLTLLTNVAVPASNRRNHFPISTLNVLAASSALNSSGPNGTIFSCATYRVLLSSTLYRPLAPHHHNSQELNNGPEEWKKKTHKAL